MLIGLDGLPLSELKTGVGHYTFELACALARVAPADEFEIVSPRPFISQAGGESSDQSPSNLHMTQAKVGAFSRHWWTIGLPRYIRRRGVALFHGTNYDVPLWKGCPTVLTIHDLSLLLHPQTHEARRVGRARRRLPLMARAATMIVTPSRSVRREVCEHLRVSPDKVVAVAEAPRSVFHRLPPAETVEVRRRLKIEDEFLLFVGTIEPRKNLKTLVRAFAEVLRRTNTKLQLVVAGKKGWLTDEMLAQVSASNVAEHVRFTGYVSEDELRALYSSCRAFVYPSLYEGFGLPPLEAMACGAPVISSDIASVREVTANGALLVSPENVHELAESIIALLGDDERRRQLAADGLSRAAKFTWERTARATLEVYLEAIRRESQK